MTRKKEPTPSRRLSLADSIPSAIGPALTGSSHSFKYGKFALASGPAERIELRVGVGKECRGGIEFYYTPFLEEHHLAEVIDLRNINE